MTIKEYWNLIDQQPFLTITWEPDFSRSCSFLRMLMNHKNKTNDMVFLKSLKTMFLGHFWPFLPDGDFYEKIRLSHTTIDGPLTPCYIWTPNTPNIKFSDKTNEPIPRKLTDRSKDEWKDGRTDGWTLFYRSLLGLGVQ